MSDTIAVVGAGQMGNGIAHVAAASGHSVTMIDVAEAALEKGRAIIAGNMERQVISSTGSLKTWTGWPLRAPSWRPTPVPSRSRRLPRARNVRNR
jgi:2-polyprenyl-6-methoxyphenol hydroxylase-like FAD-dependent oxidoreductase